MLDVESSGLRVLSVGVVPVGDQDVVVGDTSIAQILCLSSALITKPNEDIPIRTPARQSNKRTCQRTQGIQSTFRGERKGRHLNRSICPIKSMARFPDFGQYTYIFADIDLADSDGLLTTNGATLPRCRRNITPMERVHPCDFEAGRRAASQRK